MAWACVSLTMWAKARLAGAAVIAFMVVAVDFTSRLLSMAADGMLIIGLAVLLWPMLRSKKQ